MILKVFIGLITITSLILFIIGLRLYIVNKDTDKDIDKDKYIKKENTAIIFMGLSGAVLITIIFLYINYKIKGGFNIFEFLNIFKFL